MNSPKYNDAVLGGDRPSPSMSDGSAVIGITNRYDHPKHRQFCLDMAAAQLPVKHYEGRFFWSGPSIQTPDIQDVLSFTKVKCVWEQSGKHNWIVYPKDYGKQSILEIQALIESNQFPLDACIICGYSESYKRQVDALLEMIEAEFNLRLVKQ